MVEGNGRRRRKRVALNPPLPVHSVEAPAKGIEGAERNTLGQVLVQ